MTSITDSNLTEAHGTIKFYLSKKGYGFVELPDGSKDIFFTRECLNRHNHDTVQKDSRIHVKYKVLDDGTREVVEILSIDNNVARKKKTYPDASPFVPAKVKRILSNGDYAFVTRGEDTDDIFVHISTMNDAGLTRFPLGQSLLVSYVTGKRGLKAVKVKVDS